MALKTADYILFTNAMLTNGIVAAHRKAEVSVDRCRKTSPSYPQEIQLSVIKKFPKFSLRRQAYFCTMPWLPRRHSHLISWANNWVPGRTSEKTYIYVLIWIDLRGTWCRILIRKDHCAQFWKFSLFLTWHNSACSLESWSLTIPRNVDRLVGNIIHLLRKYFGWAKTRQTMDKAASTGSWLNSSLQSSRAP